MTKFVRVQLRWDTQKRVDDNLDKAVDWDAAAELWDKMIETNRLPVQNWEAESVWHRLFTTLRREMWAQLWDELRG